MPEKGKKKLKKKVVVKAVAEVIPRDTILRKEGQPMVRDKEFQPADDRDIMLRKGDQPERKI